MVSQPSNQKYQTFYAFLLLKKYAYIREKSNDFTYIIKVNCKSDFATRIITCRRKLNKKFDYDHSKL